jgi:hypothetical protein
MKVEFRQGVPEGCTEWLNKNVGKGNRPNIEDSDDYAWFYSREMLSGDVGVYYVPSITVKDPKLAMLFVLRWSA